MLKIPSSQLKIYGKKLKTLANLPNILEIEWSSRIFYILCSFVRMPSSNLLFFVCVSALIALGRAGDCPCAPAPDHNCYSPTGYSRFNSLAATNATVESRQSVSCTLCLFSVGSAQQSLQQCCQGNNCPSPNYTCECNLFISNCNANFAYFPKMKQNCYNDVYSITYGEMKLLEDPFTTPDEICNDAGACP